MTVEKHFFDDLEASRKYVESSNEEKFTLEVELPRKLILEILKVAIRREVGLKKLFQKMIKMVFVFDEIERVDSGVRIVVKRSPEEEGERFVFFEKTGDE